MNLLKATVIALLVSIMMLGTTTAYAADLSAPPKPTTTQTIEEIDEQLLNLNKAAAGYRYNMAKAHLDAEYARELGLPEDCIQIKDAKQTYCSNKALLSMVTKDIEKLNSDRKSLNKYTYFDTFKLTGYCPCSKCCGKWANGITASGVTAKEGVTIAADPRVLPLGTKVFIEGLGERIVQDTGGAIKNKKIDVYVSYHSKAYNSIYNQKQAKVWIINE